MSRCIVCLLLRSSLHFDLFSNGLVFSSIRRRSTSSSIVSSALFVFIYLHLHRNIQQVTQLSKHAVFTRHGLSNTSCPSSGVHRDKHRDRCQDDEITRAASSHARIDFSSDHNSDRGLERVGVQRSFPKKWYEGEMVLDREAKGPAHILVLSLIHI